ncbi:unnamed protein product [Nippostrongylus brasiliensis]|uniref:Transmembrane protein n=1 Tax=Nippostrongylus brasiliensis TaxID=27835 RepID=A0A0N4YSV3_NIPBR|nr:unnamed protein product [Nippostrongylus brasiliensis]
MPRNKEKIDKGPASAALDCETDEPISQSWRSLTTGAFDGDLPKYKCCCGHVHATTGTQIIVALLSITVFFDMWQVISGLATSSELDQYDLVSVCIRFGMGAAFTGTMLISLLTERPGLLIPYLGAGLAAGMVFFVASLYITLFGDRSTVASFLRSMGYLINLPGDAQLYYHSWLVVAWFAIIILLQLWLMKIVTACWRDKRAYGRMAEDLEVPSRPLSKVSV